MHDHSDNQQALAGRQPWNKGRLIGQKPPLKLKDVWAIRLRLQLAGRVRDLALFNLALDSKLRGCDLVRLRVADIVHGESVMPRATVIQHKTGRPVRFELTEPTREAVRDWLLKAKLGSADPLFPSRSHRFSHLSTRQYARIVKSWVMLVWLDPRDYGTHSLRRTKARLIYRRTKNLRAVQLLLGHTNLQSTVRYLGLEVDDALEIAEQTEMYYSQAESVRARRGVRAEGRSVLCPPPLARDSDTPAQPAAGGWAGRPDRAHALGDSSKRKNIGCPVPNGRDC